MLRRVSALLLLALTVGCGQQPGEKEDAPSPAERKAGTVYTVNYPLAFFAEYLSQGRLQVELPVPAQEDPAYWQPEPEIVLAYQQADLILLNGPGYAWVNRVSLPAKTQVDTSTAYTERFIELDTGPVHSHGPEGAHSHGEIAFTTWLDLSLASLQAAAVAQALQTLNVDPQDLEQRLAALQSELSSIDAALIEAGQILDNAPVLFSHPVYQYLSDRYGLNGQALHWEPEIYPDEADWNALDKILSEHPATIMLWEDQPIAEIEIELRKRGIVVVLFKPLGRRPNCGDFLAVMETNVQLLSAAATAM